MASENQDGKKKNTNCFISKTKAEFKKNLKKKIFVFPYRESNPGRLGENQES